MNVVSTEDARTILASGLTKCPQGRTLQQLMRLKKNIYVVFSGISGYCHIWSFCRGNHDQLRQRHAINIDILLNRSCPFRKVLVKSPGSEQLADTRSPQTPMRDAGKAPGSCDSHALIGAGFWRRKAPVRLERLASDV